MDHQAFAQLLGNYGEFVGAVAVVATLIYLAVQVGQNTKMMRATIRQEFASNSIDGLLRFADQADVVSRVFAEQPTWETPQQEVAGEMIMTAVFRAWENQAWMHQQGLMPETEWVALVEDMRYRGTFPFCVEQWHKTRTRFSIHLQETLDPTYGA